jgi:hypothetical protein
MSHHEAADTCAINGLLCVIIHPASLRLQAKDDCVCVRRLYQRLSSRAMDTLFTCKARGSAKGCAGAERQGIQDQRSTQPAIEGEQQGRFDAHALCGSDDAACSSLFFWDLPLIFRVADVEGL